MKSFIFSLIAVFHMVSFAGQKRMLGGYIIDIDYSLYDLSVLRRSLKTPTTMIKNKKTGQIFYVSTSSFPLNFKNASNKSSWCIDGVKSEKMNQLICEFETKTKDQVTKSMSLQPQIKLSGNVEIIHTLSFSAKNNRTEELSKEALLLLQRIKK